MVCLPAILLSMASALEKTKKTRCGVFLEVVTISKKVLNVIAASRFGCVAILALHLSVLLLTASLTVEIPRSLRLSSFLTYHGAFTIVLRILACIVSILYIFFSFFFLFLYIHNLSHLDIW